MTPVGFDPLQSFNSEGEDVILSLAVSWSGAVREQLANAKHRVDVFHKIDRLYERNDGDVTIDHVAASWQAAWISESLLVISADNLERWIARLYLERGRPAPEPHPLLRALRNSIEHLNDARFDDPDEDWTARPANERQRKHGIGLLPEGELAISVGSRDSVFDLIGHDELKAIVEALLDELDRESYEYEQALIDFYREDR